MKNNNRTPWQLVEEQLQKWNVMKAERRQEKIAPGPIITISREAGCGAAKIAQELAKILDMDLMSGKIIQMVAESAEMSEKVILSLDEKDISKRDDWLNSLFESRHLWPDQYLFHLTKVIGTIGTHGSAIILGRCANFVLPQKNTFNLRIIAPEAVKIKNILRTAADEAKRYIIKTEADRRAFARKYFNADITDPAHYDLIINMRAMSIDGAVETIRCAFNAWKM
ncbi:MAG: cytidylate kinase-like family protein [Syntrophales bacterium]|nr:cytidylate kinase-like family protein [Syntrophales bacterium]